MLVFLNPQCREELGQRDTVCLGSLADGLAAGDGAAYAAHAELEECLGCLGLGLEKIIDSAVCVYFSHSILRLAPCDINLTIAAMLKIIPTLSLPIPYIITSVKMALLLKIPYHGKNGER